MKKYLGFTLIEVMVVMVIIAVLATAGISSYAWYVKESVSIKNDAYAQHVNGAIMQFRSDHNGRAPQNDAELADYLAMSTAPSHSILSSLTLFPTVFAATISMLPSNVLDAGYPARGRNDCVTDDGSFVQCAIAALFFSNGDHIIIYGQLTRKRITNYHTYTINGMSISGASIGKSGLIASTTAEITTQSVTDYGAGL